MSRCRPLAAGNLTVFRALRSSSLPLGGAVTQQGRPGLRPDSPLLCNRFPHSDHRPAGASSASQPSTGPSSDAGQMKMLPSAGVKAPTPVTPLCCTAPPCLLSFLFPNQESDLVAEFHCLVMGHVIFPMGTCISGGKRKKP